MVVKKISMYIQKDKNPILHWDGPWYQQSELSLWTMEPQLNSPHSFGFLIKVKEYGRIN